MIAGEGNMVKPTAPITWIFPGNNALDGIYEAVSLTFIGTRGFEVQGLGSRLRAFNLRRRELDELHLPFGTIRVVLCLIIAGMAVRLVRFWLVLA